MYRPITHWERCFIDMANLTFELAQKKPLTDQPSDVFWWVLLWMHSGNEQLVEKTPSSQEQMLTSRLGSPSFDCYLMLQMFTSSNWRVVNFPLSPKSHGSTFFHPDLPGGSFQTPAIFSVGGGGQWSPGPRLQRNRLPAHQGWRQQQRLEKEVWHSSGGDVAEPPKGPSRGRLAPLPKASYRWIWRCQMGSCRVSSMAWFDKNWTCCKAGSSSLSSWTLSAWMLSSWLTCPRGRLLKRCRRQLSQSETARNYWALPDRFKKWLTFVFPTRSKACRYSTAFPPICKGPPTRLGWARWLSCRFLRATPLSASRLQKTSRLPVWILEWQEGC